MERVKITEKDNVRLLYVTTWFLEFFLSVRKHEGESAWGFLLVRAVVEEDWVKWVLRRMREANDDKVDLKFSSNHNYSHLPFPAEAMDRTACWDRLSHPAGTFGAIEQSRIE